MTETEILEAVDRGCCTVKEIQEESIIQLSALEGDTIEDDHNNIRNACLRLMNKGLLLGKKKPGEGRGRGYWIFWLPPKQ